MGGTIAIIAIAVVVLLVGYVVAKKVFVRGSMPEKPEEDKPVGQSIGADREPGVSHDQQAVGRPSDRGYEQKL